MEFWIQNSVSCVTKGFVKLHMYIHLKDFYSRYIYIRSTFNRIHILINSPPVPGLQARTLTQEDMSSIGMNYAARVVHMTFMELYVCILMFRCRKTICLKYLAKY